MRTFAGRMEQANERRNSNLAEPHALRIIGMSDEEFRKSNPKLEFCNTIGSRNIPSNE